MNSSIYEVPMTRNRAQNNFNSENQFLENLNTISKNAPI